MEGVRLKYEHCGATLLAGFPLKGSILATATNRSTADKPSHSAATFLIVTALC